MIVSTTLAGPGAEHTLGDALRSVVDQVDRCLVAFSGCDEELTRAAVTDAVGDKARFCELTWPGRYDHARQAMLDWAGSFGAEWAVTVDCDERVTLAPDYRDILRDHPGADVWNLRGCDHGPCDNQSPGHGYCKERILRANAGLRWHGRVCENVQSSKQGVLHVGHFWENTKTPEQERRRYERGVVECQRMIDEGDDRYKWWRHMGSCHAGLGRMSQALECYEQAIQRPHGAEDEARCTYLICELLVIAERFDEAHDRAALALAKHAGFIPEFGSILAWVQMKRGDIDNASRWAQLVQICPPDRKRIGHRGKECHERAKAVLGVLDAHNRAVTAGKVVGCG